MTEVMEVFKQDPLTAPQVMICQNIKSKIKHNQTGGIVMGIKDQWMTKIMATSSNRMGRWATAMICGTKGKAPTIITAYNCCKNTKADNTIWNQKSNFIITESQQLENPTQGNSSLFLKQAGLPKS
jgi:hypothetical protein